MSRRDVSGWMFLLVPTHSGRQRAVKRSCVCLCVCVCARARACVCVCVSITVLISVTKNNQTRKLWSKTEDECHRLITMQTINTSQQHYLQTEPTVCLHAAKVYLCTT